MKLETLGNGCSKKVVGARLFQEREIKKEEKEIHATCTGKIVGERGRLKKNQQSYEKATCTGKM